MNAGYFIEQDLMYQTDAYNATVQPSDEKSTLQKDVEDNENIDKSPDARTKSRSL